MADLSGKSIIVTGGGSGIGLTTCHVLSDNHAKLVVADRNLDAAERVASDLRERGADAAAVHVDIALEESVEAMVQFAIDTFGRLDGAHNNAGVEMSNKAIDELTAEE